MIPFGLVFSSFYQQENLPAYLGRGPLAFVVSHEILHSLDTSGRGHMETIHAGCPVLLGHKDITNYWFWYQGQERHRPCLREQQVRNV